MLRCLAISLLLASTLLVSSRVAAQSSQGGSVPMSPIPAGETRDAQARLGALRASPSGDLTVMDERLSLRCERADDALVECEVEVRWSLSSPRDQEARFYASAVGVEHALLTTGEDSTDAPSLAPLTTRFVADTPREIVLTGRIRLRPDGGTTDALDARHMVLATPRVGPHATLLFTRAVARTFAASPTTMSVSTTFAGETPRFSARALDTAMDEAPITLSAEQLGERANVPIRIERDGGFPLRHGGPFLGLGGTFDRGFRGRVGYELGIDELVTVGVMLDSDFSESIVLGAIVEVATPSFVVPPSLSAGVGFVQRWRVGVLPAGIAPTSSGFRLEVGAVFAVIGIVASFDYFPDDAAFTSSLLGRLSL
ncbi:MAG: hypothetical protein J0L92_00565 [Deltaproteobacteria bacterium]|nr:hypothetical protein [Deltaproteobacteria bacterium]